MSYGTSGYGTSSYGGAEAALTIVRAKPLSPHVVRVTLSKQPQVISPILLGDVLNVRTWKIVRLDTDVGFNVLKITAGDPPLDWDIRVLESFGSANISHRVSSVTLLDEGGSPIDAPRNTEFLGTLQKTKSTVEELAARRKFAIRDIDNPAFPKGSNPGGVFTVSSDGDYLLHEGSDFVRKLIFRRLMTSKGGFYHLPNYGVGLRVKEPLPAGDLISLQKEIKDQIEQEPEIVQSRVIVTQDRGALTLVILARLEPTGQQISFPLRIPFAVNL